MFYRLYWELIQVLVVLQPFGLGSVPVCIEVSVVYHHLKVLITVVFTALLLLLCSKNLAHAVPIKANNASTLHHSLGSGEESSIGLNLLPSFLRHASDS